MRRTALVVLVLLTASTAPCPGAGYRAHQNDRDMDAFLSAWPSARDGRIDACGLCHPGGTVTGKKDQPRVMDGCTYCHDQYGLIPPHGPVPLNAFGRDYLTAGRDRAAARSLAARDSDGDGASNWREILHGTFPGDPTDRPGLTRAPSRRFTRTDLLALPRTTVTLLMNTHKSGDYYATFKGVAFDDLLRAARVSPRAERVTFFCPDGYTYTVPLRGGAAEYRLLGNYPQGRYHAGLPWCGTPEDWKLPDGAPLPGRLRPILAYERDGEALATARLNRDGPRWVIDGEGPYRLILPQPRPSAPDQPSDKAWPDHPYPFDEGLDHNGGVCVRCVVALRVEPLPEGTTEVDWSREGWAMVESGTLVVYGALEGR